MSQDIIIQDLLEKGVSRVIDRAHLEERLKRSDKLVIKFGIDPVASRLHIGHMIPFMKLRQFQKLGHTVVLLFGDATAQVGDTSDKDAERPMLTRAETAKNAEAFLEKFSRIVDISKINIYYNSEGLDQVNFAGVGELAKNFSVAEMLDRDNFSKRYKEGKRISLQEFLYPIMQGYDSVAIARKYGSCDVELGGNDQYFNLLAGRTLMAAHGLPKQDIMTFELLIGTDGKKMSKSTPNCILIDDTPFDMYQKLINVDDALILHYFELATDMTLEEVSVIRKRLENGEHPNVLKIELAQRIITMYHGKPYNANDVENIEKVSLKELRINNQEEEFSLTTLDHEKENISELLKLLKFCATSGDVRNALAGNSVRVDSTVVTNPKFLVQLSSEGVLIEMGKKKAKRVFL